MNNDIEHLVSIEKAIELRELGFNERTAYFYVAHSKKVIPNSFMEDDLLDLKVLKQLHNVDYIKAPYKEQARRFLISSHDSI